MKRGVDVSWGTDYHDIPVLTIKKKRGKLTLDEIEDALRFGDGQQLCGHYAILLNCTEATVGGNGLWDLEEDKGDTVSLYPIEEGETCPICSKYVPPFRYCPTCGTAWKDMDQDVETLLASMRAETVREIERAGSDGAKSAWYWTHIGALDMARQLDLISDQRRQELYAEFAPLKPNADQQE